jgi:hypothetical protein
MLMIVSGCFSPSTSRRSPSTLTDISSSSSYRPCAWYVAARDAMLSIVSGCFSPSTSRRSPKARLSTGSFSLHRPRSYRKYDTLQQICRLRLYLTYLRPLSDSNGMRQVLLTSCPCSTFRRREKPIHYLQRPATIVCLILFWPATYL